MIIYELKNAIYFVCVCEREGFYHKLNTQELKHTPVKSTSLHVGAYSVRVMRTTQH